MKVDTRNAVVERQKPASGWEYRTNRMGADESLDRFGADGWELVSVIPAPGDPGLVVAYFKRRRG